MAGLSLNGVSKSFGDVDIIHGVDLEIADGEFVVFVGPSGCGKSTLLRLIAGLEELSAGRITIGARDVSGLEPAARRVAMVFQSYALYPHMTVERNIGFAMRMGGMSKPEVRAKVDAVATILQLEELLDRRPSQLSGGQRQRVAIGRAIVRQPEVFLFDEPLSNLDAELRVEMRIEIAKLHQTLAATMIYVTHDQVEAMTLADKIVVLRAGRVEQVGSPLTLYDDPANLFVAGFIGSPKMNFLRAVPTGTAEGRQVVTLPEFGDIAVPLALKTSALPPDLLLGIRPEHFRPDAPIQLTATVDVIEHLGGSSFAYAKGEGSRLVIELRDNRQVRAGEALTATFDPARAFLFDRSTGQRLR